MIFFTEHEDSKKEKSIEYLEPAIWFKVGLIDTLYIDCWMRKISWRQKKPEKILENELIKSHSIFVREEYTNEYEENLEKLNTIQEEDFDFVNKLDDVFDELQLLCLGLKNENSQSLNLSKSLINFLHYNILPLIKLQPSHLILIKNLMKQQEKFLINLNDLISMKSIKVEELKSSKKRNRKNLRSIINSCIDMKFQSGLTKLLEHEFDLDLRDCMCEYKKVVAEFDKAVNKMDNQDEYLENLKSKKQELKSEIISINKAMGKLSNSHKKKGWLKYFVSQFPIGDDAQLQKIYLQMNWQLEEFRKDYYFFMDKKLMVSSVMEAIRCVINELKLGNESYGIEIEKKSRKQVNDILTNSFGACSFKTLPDQINNILKDFLNPITSNHVKVEFEIRSSIESTLYRCKQQKLYNRLVETINFRESNSFILSKKPKSLGNGSSFLNTSLKNLCKLNSNKDKLDEYSIHTSISLPNIFFNNDLRTNFTAYNIEEKIPTFQCYIEDFLQIDYNFSYVTETLDQLKEKIINHFLAICSDLQLETDKAINELNYRKIWAIYENYFFENILEPLIELYMMEYENKVKVFVEKITTLNIKDLDLTSSSMARLLLCSNDYKQKDINSTDKTHTSSLPSSFNSQSKVIFNFENFLGSTEKIDIKSNEISSSSDFTDSFESEDDEALALNHSKQVPTNSQHILSHTKCDLLTDVKLTPLTSVSSSEILTTDISNEITFNESISVTLQPFVLSCFKEVYECLKKVVRAETLMKKIHYLNISLKKTSFQLEKLNRETRGKISRACNDDLMDTVVILICNISDPTLLAGIYVQVKLMTDYLASFYEFGEYKFTLTLFLGVFNHLQDKIFMKNNKELLLRHY